MCNFCVPCGDLTAKFAKNDAKDAKKQTKYLHLIKKIFIPLSYITKKYKTMEITADTPPDKPKRLANRTGGTA
ncbi:hypothetical protein Tanf_10295 [Tannerella forsythia]|uniref:Uncharacterized protein n=1 Tax=Tannerella forsythia TaxID=28112 RepID=A0A2A6E4N1_TANFO|nr:hypothetical protein Tanf_10295 [Tannerella forsythia]PDP41748.1 hypothetical protein CLI86_13370 [Tannerella forsythia]TPE16511.1 hypothetical protein FJN16_09785 [Tannerella forsythia]TPE17983.1 hypothetical protein FJN16_05420 [Tannerella forsythia]